MEELKLVVSTPFKKNLGSLRRKIFEFSLAFDLQVVRRLPNRVKWPVLSKSAPAPLKSGALIPAFDSREHKNPPCLQTAREV